MVPAAVCSVALVGFGLLWITSRDARSDLAGSKPPVQASPSTEKVPEDAPANAASLSRKKTLDDTLINAPVLEAEPGSALRFVVRAYNNNGVVAARFEYDGDVLPTETIQGLPGCTFTVAPSINYFESVVSFDPAAFGARYELLEVSSNGALKATGAAVVHGGGAPVMALRIFGRQKADEPHPP